MAKKTKNLLPPRWDLGPIQETKQEEGLKASIHCMPDCYELYSSSPDEYGQIDGDAYRSLYQSCKIKDMGSHEYDLYIDEKKLRTGLPKKGQWAVLFFQIDKWDIIENKKPYIFGQVVGVTYDGIVFLVNDSLLLFKRDSIKNFFLFRKNANIKFGNDKYQFCLNLDTEELSLFKSNEVIWSWYSASQAIDTLNAMLAGTSNDEDYPESIPETWSISRSWFQIDGEKILTNHDFHEAINCLMDALRDNKFD